MASRTSTDAKCTLSSVCRRFLTRHAYQTASLLYIADTGNNRIIVTDLQVLTGCVDVIEAVIGEIVLNSTTGSLYM